MCIVYIVRYDFDSFLKGDYIKHISQYLPGVLQKHSLELLEITKKNPYC
jgi:hypothetical protein